MLDADRLGHRIGFLACRDLVLVEPNVLGRLALLEEQQVGGDRGIGLEHGIGQADDGVEVALLHNSPVKKSRFDQATSDAAAMISAAPSASNTARIMTVIASAV